MQKEKAVSLTTDDFKPQKYLTKTTDQLRLPGSDTGRARCNIYCKGMYCV